MSDSDDYNESVVMVDPNDIEIPSDHEPDEDELTIDCDYEIDKDGYDPMSLVSVGLEDDDDDDEEDELTGGEAVETVETGPDCVACQYCGRVLSDQESYRRHLHNVHQVRLSSVLDGGITSRLVPDKPHLSRPRPDPPCSPV